MLRLQANDGSEGWGEISDVSHLPAMQPDVEDLERVLNALLGRALLDDLNTVADLMLANFPGTRFHGKACLVRAGVSIAMHDLKARCSASPSAICSAEHGRTRIPICYPIFRMKHRGDVHDRVRLVSEQFDRGFSKFRLYFGSSTDADVELLQQICGKFGNLITLTSLDGSGLFTLPAFLRAYRRLKDFPFESIESPVDRDDVRQIAEARRSIDHPVSEHVRSPEYAIRLIRQRPSISSTFDHGRGRHQGMLRLFAVADSANIECLIGTTQELSVATVAQAHVGAVAPRLDYASDPSVRACIEKDVTAEPAAFRRRRSLGADRPRPGLRSR